MLRGAWGPVLLTSLALSALAWAYSSSRPAEYLATTSLAALPTNSSNSVINNSLVTAPALPAGVVERALRSPTVKDDALKRLQGSLSGTARRTTSVRAFLSRLRSASDELVALKAEIDQNLTGSYEISARGPTPTLATATADAFTQALLAWDRQRALEGINRARTNLLTQRDLLNGQLSTGGQNVGESTLTQMRSEVAQALQQIEVLRRTVTGALTPISPAVPPTQPVSPRPLRDALLTFGATAFFGVLLALLRDRLGQRVRDADTLKQFGLPLLGTLPTVPRRRLSGAGVKGFMRSGEFREALEFVRVGLLSGLGDAPTGAAPRRVPLIAVTSADPNEGKSTVAAGLAVVCAKRGVRVLMVDADIYRRRQKQLLAGGRYDGAVRTVGQAQLWENVLPNIDLMTLQSSRLEPAELHASLRELAQPYDIVLIDTPPALRVADTLALSRLIDGLLLVVDVDTPLPQVERLVSEAAQARVHTLGFVLNRDRTNGSSYLYQNVQPVRAGQGTDA